MCSVADTGYWSSEGGAREGGTIWLINVHRFCFQWGPENIQKTQITSEEGQKGTTKFYARAILPNTDFFAPRPPL